jgi:hypothetical protein
LAWLSRAMMNALKLVAGDGIIGELAASTKSTA